MPIRCGKHTIFSLLTASQRMGILLTTSGINTFLQRYLCSCGAFFAIGFQQKTTWCNGVSFIKMTWRVWQVAGVRKRLNIFFLGCNIFSSLWSHVWHWLGISSVSSGDLRQHFGQFTNMAGMPRFTDSFFTAIWFASIWVIWKERNYRVYQNTAFDPSILIEKVKLNSFLWLKLKQATFSYSYHEWWKNSFLCMDIHL